jgi:divalent metal cation (Fe/Co/Zn/Cd) transporter
VEQPLLDGGDEPEQESPEHRALQRRMRIAMVASLVVNVALLLSKIVAYVLSRSKSVLASSADSFVDIASQARSVPSLLAARRCTTP